MLTKEDVLLWAASLPPGSFIGVDESGLCLRSVFQDKMAEHWLEVGGIPEESENKEGELPLWNVMWSKTYIASGVEQVRASTAESAEEQVAERLGDLEGSQQYDPDQDTVEAVNVVHI